jgi:hypothetical protein
VDPFAIIILGGIAGLVIALFLLGRYFPGSGADQLDWKPTRSVEQEVQNEIDDLDQMREAVNRRRRARGGEELTEEGVRANVAQDLKKQTEMRDRYTAADDIEQMLEAKNARLRRRGRPEITEAEFRASLGDGSG